MKKLFLVVTVALAIASSSANREHKRECRTMFGILSTSSSENVVACADELGMLVTRRRPTRALKVDKVKDVNRKYERLPEEEQQIIGACVFGKAGALNDDGTFSAEGVKDTLRTVLTSGELTTAVNATLSVIESGDCLLEDSSNTNLMPIFKYMDCLDKACRKYYKNLED